MRSVPDAILVGNVPRPHGDVHQGIALVQEIIVPAVDIPAYRPPLFIRHVLNQPKDAMTVEIGFDLRVGEVRATQSLPELFDCERALVRAQRCRGGEHVWAM